MKPTVKKYVAKLREDEPNARIEVLYDPQGGWGRSNSLQALSESEWGEYRVEYVEHLDELIIVTAS